MFDLSCSELLKVSAGMLGVDISNETAERMMIYMALLKEWNKKLNLTSIKDDSEIVLKHFTDSLSIVPFINKYLLDSSEDLSLIDAGTGAGFPGLPVRIYYDGLAGCNINMKLKFTLMDSLEKRLVFLNHVIKEIGLDNIKLLHSRAEDAGNNALYREKFTFCTARAVASLQVLSEYCLPLVKTGGIFISMKGPSAEEELSDAKYAMNLLGGKIENVAKFKLPYLNDDRIVIEIRKFRHTPSNYPRKAGIPSKNPLNAG